MPVQPILITDREQPARDLRLFLAGLCLFQFYYQFVQAGLDLWGGISSARDFAHDKHAALAASIALPQSLLFFFLARSLLRQERVRGLLIALAVTQCLLLIAALAEDEGLSIHPRLFQSLRDCVPWLTPGVMAVIGIRWPKKIAPCPAWAFAAAGWCLVCPLLAFFNGLERYSIIGWGFRGWLPRNYWMVVAITYLPVMVATALVLRWQALARLAAFVTAIVGVAPQVLYEFVVLWMAARTTEAVLYSAPGTRERLVNPMPWPWLLLTREVTQTLAVDVIAYCGPWLWIAYCTRRLGLQAPPEDGSDYPRRYCPRCLYNLQGISGARCPECGTEIVVAADCATEAAHAGPAMAS